MTFAQRLSGTDYPDLPPGWDWTEDGVAGYSGPAGADFDEDESHDPGFDGTTPEDLASWLWDRYSAHRNQRSRPDPMPTPSSRLCALCGAPMASQAKGRPRDRHPKCKRLWGWLGSTLKGARALDRELGPDARRQLRRLLYTELARALPPLGYLDQPRADRGRWGRKG